MFQKYLWMVLLGVVPSFLNNFTPFMDIKMEIIYRLFSCCCQENPRKSIILVFLHSSNFILQFQPSVVHIDFEKAVMTVISQLLPDSTIKCCRFHLAQAWWRQIQKIGLSSEYKDPESEIGRWLKSMFGIAYLSPDEVEDSFVEDYMSVAPGIKIYIYDCANEVGFLRLHYKSVLVCMHRQVRSDAIKYLIILPTMHYVSAVFLDMTSFSEFHCYYCPSACRKKTRPSMTS